MNLKTATILTLSMAFAATLAAAPQATKPATTTTKAPAAKTEQAKPAAKPAAAKVAPEKVMTADIPAPVKDAVMKMHPKATISGATKTMAGTVAWYSVSYMDGAKKGSMKLDAMGKPAAPKAKK